MPLELKFYFKKNNEKKDKNKLTILPFYYA